MRVVGVLSGTSIDGIDVAVVDILDRQKRMEQCKEARMAQDYEYVLSLKCFECIEWKSEIRERVRHAMNDQNLSARDFCEINVLIGQEFARAIMETLDRNGIDRYAGAGGIELIGSHGQTMWHQVGREEKIKGTWQLGDSSIIANALHVDVVDDFRSMDVAMGGQGAPLISLFDYLTLNNRHENKIVIVNNIGGMSNATLLPPLSDNNNDAEEKIMSFDTGPGNIMIDEAVRLLSHNTLHMDKDGQWASIGNCHPQLLQEMLSHPYFSEPLPKTTGREQFGTRQVNQWIRRAKDFYHLSDADIICTLTHLTVNSIVMAYEQAIQFKYKSDPISIHSVSITGGGAHNKFMIHLLEKRIHQVFNDTSIMVQCADRDKFADAKEAMLFALLAYLFIKNRNGNIKQVTGASHNAVLGKLTRYRTF
jgi:anhydro-N-acetylmuramic acid kinase